VKSSRADKGLKEAEEEGRKVGDESKETSLGCYYVADGEDDAEEGEPGVGEDDLTDGSAELAAGEGALQGVRRSAWAPEEIITRTHSVVSAESTADSHSGDGQTPNDGDEGEVEGEVLFVLM